MKTDIEKISDVRTRALSAAELERINHMTALRVQRIQKRQADALAFTADARREDRLKARQCTWCFYGGDRGMLVGHAFTAWMCELCPAENTHHNTGVPRVCCDCSDAFALCVSCGGDIELKRKTRRDAKARRARKARKKDGPATVG